MKTKEELQQLKKEFEELNSKLKQLSEDELKEVCGGINNNDEQILTSTIWDIAVKLKEHFK